MKKREAVYGNTPNKQVRKCISTGIAFIVMIFFFGCAGVPKPVVIKHREERPQVSAAVPAQEGRKLEEERPQVSVAAPGQEGRKLEEERPQVSAAVPAQEGRKLGAEGDMAALVELLKKKNVISADEAVHFAKQYSVRPDAPKEARPATEGIAGLVGLLESKNILTSAEADKLAGQYGMVIVRVKKAGPASEGIDEELKKSLPENVKSQLQEEITREVRKSDKERIDKITANVTENLKKGLQEEAKSEIQEEVRKELKKAQLAAVPEWTKRIRFGGDIRLRYENDRFDKNNSTDVFKPNDPTTPMNTTMDKNLYRYRARLHMSAEISDKAEVTIGLATGNETNPVSTNTTLGNNFNKDKFLVDLAYLNLRPWRPLTFYAGRMPNPWFSSDLVWDRDLNFDGVALNVKETFKEAWTPFLTLGIFPLQEVETSQHMKYLTAAQTGLEKKSEKGIGFKIGVAYYYFRNVTGVLNDPYSNDMDWTAPGFQQKGNTLFDINNTTGATSKMAYASEFKELNLTGRLDINLWNPYRITFLADYVKNYGFNLADVRSRAGNDVPNEDARGYQFGVTVGYPEARDFGQWKASLHYKYLQPDAVIDAYTDSDFHLGGTNAKGWILGAEFGLIKNVWLAFRWLTADEIYGPPLAIDVFQADLNAKF